MSEPFFCHVPFDHLDHCGNRYSTCCPNWQDVSRFVYGCGDDLWKAWNHENLVEFRRALLDGDGRYCYKCPFQFSKLRKTRPRADDRPVMQRPPVTLGIAFDAACNLSCPSCRNHVIPRGFYQKPVPLTEILKQFDGLPTVAMSLAGDPFVSDYLMQYLGQPADKPEVILWTNGVLLPDRFDRIKKRVSVLIISIDGATRRTYELLRRGARFDQALRAMEFAGGLLRDGRIGELQYNYIVQGDNFREMPDFVRLAKRYGATRVQFALIAPWPNITAEEWRFKNVANPDHPAHAEFEQVLADPIMSDEIVDDSFITPEARAIIQYKPPGTDDFGRTP